MDRPWIYPMINDQKCKELQPMIETREFPIPVVDLHSNILGILEEPSFWKQIALFGWDVEVSRFLNKDFLMIEDIDYYLENDLNPKVQYLVIKDHRGFKIYSQQEIKHMALMETHKKKENMNQILRLELENSRNENQFLKTILDASFDEIFVTDAEGTTLFASESTKKYSGFSPDTFIGKNVKKLVEQGFVIDSVSLEVIRTKEVVSRQQTYPSGITVMATGKPVFNHNGKLEAVIVNSRDITELVEMKDKLAHFNSLIDKQNQLFNHACNNPVYKMLNTHSEKMFPIVDLIEKVSLTDSSIFIEGESGVGKSRLAQLIHNLSKRKENKFVQINCGAIAPTLIESELFGYVEGAFTGARKAGKIGLVEQADGGTLFLDEIGDLPLDLQVKILQLVQEKTFIPVGGTKHKEIDARIISATNKNLREKIAANLFREDLYYRLHVVPIKLPSLRERPEDISLLIDYFLNRFNSKYSYDIKISDSARNILMEYSWPGNIRELENIIEQMIVTANSTVIQISDLPKHIQMSDKASLPGVKVTGILPLNSAVEETEKQILSRAIQKYKTSRKIAKALKVNQTTILRKVRKYNLSLVNQKQTSTFSEAQQHL